MSRTKKKKKDWVLPASIPFADLKSKDLEECVYWLLDAMGGKDLVWRKGGKGDGASDGGRDLEATFYVSSADGKINAQQWWIECKGRKGTVEADAVKTAIINAMARKELAQIVMATNTQFSNPTRDWVGEWQMKHPLPRVMLWDQVTLERYLSDHPQVVLRLFSQALSPEGRARAMESRFWNKLEYVPIKILTDLWKDKENFPIEGMAVFAAIVNEFAHGDITRRPWGAAISPITVIQLLVLGLENVSYLVLRSIKAGTEMQPIVRTIVYLILLALEKLPPDVVTSVIEESIYRGKKAEWPDEARELVLMPIADQLLSEMEDVCTADCQRLIGRERRALVKDKDELDTYWSRFDAKGLPDDGTHAYVWLEKDDGPCAVGFKVDAEHGCPLIHFRPKTDNLEALLKIVKRVAAFRKNQAENKRATEQREAKAREAAATRRKQTAPS